MALAPLAPEAPELAGLLIALAQLLGCLVALGLVYALYQFVRATVGGIAGIVGHVPFVGGWISSPVNKVVHWMESELSKTVGFLQHRVGAAYHDLATLYLLIGHEIGNLAWTLYSVGKVALGTDFATFVYGQLHRINVLVNRVERSAIHAAREIATTVERTTARALHGIERRTVAVEHALTGWVTADLHWLRVRERALGREYIDLFKRIKHLDYLLGAAVFAGAVAYALERLGLNWIKCRNWRKLGGGVCSIPFKILEDLFAGVVDVLLISDLCAITRYMTVVAHEAKPALLALVDGLDEFITCRGLHRPPPLPLLHSSPPPPSTGVTVTLGA